MADLRARRQRRPKRPIAYLIIIAISATVALSAAWEATRVAASSGVHPTR